MKEQLISFETAKLAKEKGCIIKSNLSYNSIGNLESYRRKFFLPYTTATKTKR
ncbi:MAG: hypothetical protein KC414_10360 [Romboutsia sp.]|nr:hypothetical protein [Romboutsia sp.]